MRSKNTITVELNQVDAAIAAVLLTERAGTAAFNALLSDKTAETGEPTNRGERALADSYLRVGNALTIAILGEKGNQGLQSTGALARSTALMADAMRASVEVIAMTEAEKEKGDGLSAVARLALREPRRRQMALVICDCSQITVDTETQAQEATIRVIRLEKIAPDDVKAAERLYLRAIEAREGRQMLPLDLQVTLEEVFGKDYRIDPTTGEIIVPDLEPRMPGDGAPDPQADAGAGSAAVESTDGVGTETEVDE